MEDISITRTLQVRFGYILLLSVRDFRIDAGDAIHRSLESS
jgi:hypothetical protein